MIYEDVIDLEKIVIHILSDKSLPQAMGKYKYVIDNLHNTNVVEDKKYQDTYKDFFALKFLVRGRKGNNLSSDEKFEKYFQILENFKNKKIDIDTAKDIYDEVYEINEREELSFATKIMHVIDNNFPIYDSVVGREHFGFYKTTTSKIDSWDIYLKYKTAFENYVRESDDAVKMIEIFDGMFPEYADVNNGGFSDIKKVDFILWKDGPFIEIPKEYRKKK